MESWVKALHIMAVISWMAAMFYLPRLYVYHADATPGSELDATLQTMEHRLLKVIMTPAMIVTWVMGLWAASNIGAFNQGWFQAKLALVVVLTIFHMALAKWRKEFALGTNTRSHKLYRIVNEIPPLLMVLIVILVVVRPF